MKQYIKHSSWVIVFLIFTTMFTNTGCDKVEFPYPEVSIIDTTFYPGLWSEYMENEYPNFGNNTNTLRNVLIEDYTGHKCNNCPNAAIIAYDIKANNPDRVFVTAIHTAPGGISSFQTSNSESSSFYTDHTNPEGLEYGAYFENGFNFLGNPQGTVNRKTVDGKMFDFSGTWVTRASNILNENELKANIQCVFNYYPSTGGGYLHTEVEKLTSDPFPINIVVYAVQDTLTDWQVMPDNSYNDSYLHKGKHLGSIDKKPWGIPVFGADEANGTKKVIDYSYQLPSDIPVSNMHLLVYVYNTETYEILQVVKQKIE